MRDRAIRNLTPPLSAFRAIFSYGGSVSGLKEKGVSNLEAAFKNAHEFAAELVERLRNGNKTAVKEVA